MVQDEILEASRGHMTEIDSECSEGLWTVLGRGAMCSDRRFRVR